FTGAINPFDAEEHHHSSDLDGGEIDLANFHTANQLPLSKVEGWNAGVFTFTSGVKLDAGLTLETLGNVDLGDNGTTTNINSSSLNVNSSTVFDGDIIVSDPSNSNFLTVDAATTF